MNALLIRLLRALGYEAVRPSDLAELSVRSGLLRARVMLLTWKNSQLTAAWAAFWRRMNEKLEQVKADLIAANTATNEIASDLDALIAKVSGIPTEDPGTAAAIAEVAAMASDLKGRLAGVAEKYTPDTTA